MVLVSAIIIRPNGSVEDTKLDTDYNIDVWSKLIAVNVTDLQLGYPLNCGKKKYSRIYLLCMETKGEVNTLATKLVNIGYTGTFGQAKTVYGSALVFNERRTIRDVKCSFSDFTEYDLWNIFKKSVPKPYDQSSSSSSSSGRSPFGSLSNLLKKGDSTDRL